MAAQDPAELFDLFEEDGTPLGRAKARAEVHRDGDWHRSLHLWVLLRSSPEASPLVVLQRRSMAKDTWPGAIDVAVTGHYRAGEGLEEVLREAEEEIGLTIGPADVTRMGLRRKRHRTETLEDNELQDIYVSVQSRALSSLTPGAEEVDGLLCVELDALEQLVEGSVTEIGAEELRTDGQIVSTALGLGELIDADDGYYEQTLEDIRGLLSEHEREC